MSNYSEFFLNSPSSVVQYELLEISHPDFSQVYRVVRNSLSALTVTLETAAEATFSYYPMQIRPLSSSNDLDQMLQVTFGDLGEVFPQELEAVILANGFSIKPVVVYRTYRSDDLTTPLFGPWALEIVNVNYTQEGATFDAKAPTINATRTGEIYTPERFPGLAGFLQ